MNRYPPSSPARSPRPCVFAAALSALLFVAGCTDKSSDKAAPPFVRQAVQRLTVPTSPEDVVKTKDGLEYMSGQVIVRFKAGTSREALAALANVEVIQSYRFIPDLHVLALTDNRTVEAAMADFRRTPGVVYAEPNWVVHVDGERSGQPSPSAIPNDARFAELWGMHNTGQTGGTADADINAPEAWDIVTGSPTAGVLVSIDTGIDYNHQDLAANMFSNPGEIPGNGVDDDGNGYVDDRYGVNTITGSGNPMDDHDHGTHTCGTMAGVGNNSVGVAGVAWTHRLMGCKFLSSSGSGTIADAVECLDWVHGIKTRATNPVDVILTSNSWGGGGFSQPFLDALGRHLTAGVLFVAAAGNANADNDAATAYPNGYFLPNVIAVAATDHNDARASFSSYGRRTVHVGAPGVNTLSTTRGNTYALFSGTSMATPHVSGLIGLLKAQDPTRTWSQLKNLAMTGGQVRASMANTITGKRIRAADAGGVGALTCSNQLLQTRIRPIPSTTSVGIGQSLDLHAYNLNCGSSAGDMTVTFTGPDSGSVVLRDSGVAPDQVAGDGMVAGQFSPANSGTYTLVFPGGETLTVNVVRLYLPAIPIPYAKRTITGTSLNLTDDSAATIPALPFPIQFGGATPGFTSIRVGSNGLMGFDAAGYISLGNTTLPNAGQQTLVAVMWDDLLPSAANNVYWQVIGTAPDQELVIEYRNIARYGVGGSGTFQVVFKEGSPNIEFHYEDVIFTGPPYDFGGNATEGVQITSTGATQLGADQPILANGTAYLWTFGNRPQIGPTESCTVTPASGAEGDTVTVDLTGFSDPDGPTDAPFIAQLDLSYDGSSFNPEIQQTISAIGPVTLTSTFNQDGTRLEAAVRIKDRVGLTSNVLVCTPQYDVVDVPPVLSGLTAPATINEGQSFTLDAVLADPGLDNPWRLDVDFNYDGTNFTPDYSTDLGVAGAFSVTHSYFMDGNYTVAMKVSDRALVESNLITIDLAVNDLRPQVAAIAAPATLTEGESATFDSTFTDPGDGASPWNVQWDFDYDGTTFDVDLEQTRSTDGAISHTREYLDSGALTVAYRVVDADGSISDVVTHALAVDEVSPLITSTSYDPASGGEGRAVIFQLTTVTGSPNPVADPIQYYLWDLDGDGLFDQLSTVPIALFRYNDNRPDGSPYLARVRVMDEDTFSDHVYSVAVDNAPPAVQPIPAAALNEGSLFSARVVASDPGGLHDPLSYQLVSKPAGMVITQSGLIDWTPTAAQATPAGTSHTVTARVTDDDGAFTDVTFVLTASNVAPTVTPLPATIAIGPANPLAQQVNAQDPGGSLTYSLDAGAPPGMTITPAGVLSWLPTRRDAFVSGGNYPVTVTVTDDDGVTATTSTTVMVRLVDTDGDGMDDEWEIGRGLDPNNPGDATGDRDSDGISNIDEYRNAAAGPFTPGLATADTPAANGTYGAGNDLSLVANNAVDPDSTSISLVFELYGDQSMTQLLGAVTVPQDASGKTTAVFDNTRRKDGSGDDDPANPNDVQLADNTSYWWRVRATDGAHPGAWDALRKFFFDPVNDPPSKPGIASPLVGDNVASRAPSLIVGNSADPDDANLTYTFEVFADAALTERVAFTATPLPAGTAGSTGWTVQAILNAHATYHWRATASDGRGGLATSDIGNFTIFLGNGEPGIPAPRTPANGATITTASVALTIDNATDPDGDALQYLFEIDTSPTFNSPARQVSPLVAEVAAGTSWTAAGLQEDTLYYWRARARDPYSSGDWFVSSFTLNATNGAPSIPTHASPTDGSVGVSDTPTLAIWNSTDSERETLVYDFEVYADTTSGTLVASSTDVAQANVQTAFAVTTKLDRGRYYFWRARAKDPAGAASDWSTPTAFQVFGGCGCGTTSAAGAVGPMLVVLGLGLLRRRRR